MAAAARKISSDEASSGGGVHGEMGKRMSGLCALLECGREGAELELRHQLWWEDLRAKYLRAANW